MTALYETWTFQQEVPGLIQDLLNRLQKQKTSTKASDCSQYNTCRAKSATLHAPTLRAILWLAELYEGLETEGAVGRCKQPLSAASRAAFPGQSGPY